MGSSIQQQPGFTGDGRRAMPDAAFWPPAEVWIGPLLEPCQTHLGRRRPAGLPLVLIEALSGSGELQVVAQLGTRSW